MATQAARTSGVLVGFLAVLVTAVLLVPGVVGASPARSSPSAPSISSLAWKNVTGAQPPFVQGDAMAWDPALKAVLFATTNNPALSCHMYTYTYANGVWKNRTSSVVGAPTVALFSSLVYDASDHYMLMFGGYDNCNPNTGIGTWEFANNTWTQVHVNVNPPISRAFGIAYDAHDGYVVLYGDAHTNTYAGDHETWTYHAGVWTLLNLTVFPAASQNIQMAPGPGGSVTLFGGGGGFTPFRNATWSFGSGAWHHLHPKNAPPGTAQGLMEYVSGLGEVLFGGVQANASWENYTYILHNGTWTNVTGSLSHSPPIVYAAYFSGGVDVATGHVIIYLSPNSSGTAVQTWALV